MRNSCLLMCCTLHFFCPCSRSSPCLVRLTDPPGGRITPSPSSSLSCRPAPPADEAPDRCPAGGAAPGGARGCSGGPAVAAAVGAGAAAEAAAQPRGGAAGQPGADEGDAHSLRNRQDTPGAAGLCLLPPNENLQCDLGGHDGVKLWALRAGGSFSEQTQVPSSSHLDDHPYYSLPSRLAR